MKVLVTGINGQLGYDAVKALQRRKHVVIGVDIAQMDITDPEAVRRVIYKECPEAVIHCAAWTDVDAAEDNAQRCRLINAAGTGNIARVCGSLDIKMLYISTDYVFNGSGTCPWETTDKQEPLSVYGQTKYEGELEVQENLTKHFIVRTSWVFGSNGGNFIKTMLRLGNANDSLSVVNDQIGSPTYTYDLADLLADIVETDRYGIYHATNEGYCSWYEFAREIFKQAKINTYISPVSSQEYPSKAIRPLNSRLSKEKLSASGFKRLPLWQDALARFLKESGY